MDNIISLLPRSGRGLKECTLSVCLQLFVSGLYLTYALMDYQINVTNVVLIETMCGDLDLGPYLLGQGHKDI